MLGKKCDGCGDKVFILKDWNDNKLCLDCLEKAESDEISTPIKRTKTEYKERNNGLE